MNRQCDCCDGPKPISVTLVPESGFEWCEGPIKCLGVDIILCHRTEDLLKLQYARSLEKIKTIIQILDKI